MSGSEIFAKMSCNSPIYESKKSQLGDLCDDLSENVMSHDIDPSRDRGAAQGVIWNFFDREADVDINARTRPHWDQAGAVTFVTIRPDDSMPKAVVKQWLQAQQDWIAQHSLEGITIDMMLQRNDSSLHLQRAFTKFRNRLWNENRDNSHGACLLRRPEVARMVAETLRHFDNLRNDLERFVVTPNHLNMLVQMRTGWSLRKQYDSWMRFSASRIHRLMRKSGHFWAEPFDHVIRNESQFKYCRQDIQDNPKKRLGSTPESP
jgi:putative transposase